MSRSGRLPILEQLRAVLSGVDSHATIPPVAPDAPAPTYDSHGNLVAEWTVSINYDAVRDVLRVHMRQEAGPYTRATVETHEYAPQDVEDAVSDLCRQVRIRGARRLF